MCPDINSQDAEFIIHNQHFILGNYLLVFLNSLAIILNLPLIVVLIAMRSTHKNIRILMCNIGVCCVVSSASSMAKSIRFLFQSAQQPFPSADFPPSTLQCKTEDAFLGITYVSLNAVMAFVAIERFVATRYHDSYHLRSSSLGWFLSAVSWLWGLSAYACVFAVDNDDDVVLCHLLFNSPWYLNIWYISYTAVISAALIPLYYKLVSTSLRKLSDFAINQAQLSLASRLELRHNVSLAQAFIPTVIAHSAVCIVSSIAQFIIIGLAFSERGVFCPPSREAVIYVAYSDCICVIQNCLYPVIIFLIHEAVARKAWDLTACLFPSLRRHLINRIAPIKGFAAQQIEQEAMTSDDHIKTLKHLWESALVPGNWK